MAEPDEETCTYCGESFPAPVELHHSEDECRCHVAKGVVIAENSAPAGVCHECGQGPDAHDNPTFAPPTAPAGAGAVAWLGIGLPARWPDA